MGRRHDRPHHSDGVGHGDLHAMDPAAPRARGKRDRTCAADGRPVRGEMGRFEPSAGSDVHAHRQDARSPHHGVQFFRFCIASVASPCPTGLLVGVREDRRRAGPGAGNRDSSAAITDAGADAVHEWHGARIRGKDFPVRVHHHRLRLD